jgi:hypothetical protein
MNQRSQDRRDVTIRLVGLSQASVWLRAIRSSP